MEKKSTKFSGYNSVLNAQATEQLNGQSIKPSKVMALQLRI